MHGKRNNHMAMKLLHFHHVEHKPFRSGSHVVVLMCVNDSHTILNPNHDICRLVIPLLDNVHYQYILLRCSSRTDLSSNVD